jgi:hypothetical protein
MIVASYILSTLLICIFVWMVRQSKPILGLIISSLLTLFMTAYWLAYGNELGLKWFSIVKFYSVFVAFFCLQGFKISVWKPLFGKILFIILALNILEAVVSDFQRKEFFSIMNACAGLALIVCQPPPSSIKTTDSPKDIIYPVSWVWVITYTVWNFAFVYSAGLTGLNASMFGLMHLAIPFAFAVLGNSSGLYLQSRTIVLFFCMFLWIFPPTRASLHIETSFFVKEIWMGLCSVSFAAAVYLVGSTYLKRR